LFDRRLLVNFDWTLLIAVGVLALIGIASLYSATSGWEGAGANLYLKQTFWFAIGLCLALLVCCFDYRHLEHLGFHFYIINLALLVAVLIFGKSTMGATRWLNLGFFNLQPSEVMKVVIIIAFARYFSGS
jgi:rod shape determining protein RodA